MTKETDHHNLISERKPFENQKPLVGAGHRRGGPGGHLCPQPRAGSPWAHRRCAKEPINLAPFFSFLDTPGRAGNSPALPLFSVLFHKRASAFRQRVLGLCLSNVCEAMRRSKVWPYKR